MALAFGSSFIAVKVAYRAFSPFQQVFLRYLVLVPVLLLLHRRMGLPRPKGGDLKWIVLLGFVEPGLYFVLDSLSLKFTTASQASLMNSTIPLWVYLLGVASRALRFHPAAFVSVALSVGGIAVVTGGEEAAALGLHALGNGLMLGAAVVAAVWTLAVRKLSARNHPLTITTWQACSTLALFTLLAPAEFAFSRPGPVTAPVLAAIVWLGLVSSGVGYWALQTGIKRGGAVLASTFVNLIPVVAIVLAHFLLSEPLRPSVLLGGLLILSGIYLLTRFETEAQPG
jgi:drug/metabolite transporter (DMT)-like permease